MNDATAFVAIRSATNWLDDVHVGNEVGVVVDGTRMVGKVHHVTGDCIGVRIPVPEQSRQIRQYKMPGTAQISLPDQAANVPVTVWAMGDLVKLQFIGPPVFVQRRRHPRIAIDLPVTVRWRDEQTGAAQEAHSRTLDVSDGGLRVASTTTVWPSRDTSVRVLVETPHGVIEEKARVLGKTPDYDLRLEFTRVSTITSVLRDAQDD